MKARFQAVKGTRDHLPPESARWAAAEALARSTFRARGYEEIRTPLLEDTALFARSVGETTDIVHKEMYTFSDRKGRSLTLRPENTAGVVRALVEHGLAVGPMPLRLFYVGPQFRYERPQAGRYREFRQIGAELFGVAGPAAEAELLQTLFAYLSALGFRHLSVTLNTVGTRETRGAFGDALREHLAPRAGAFAEEDRRKLEENPLRLFDSKDGDVRTALAGAPRPIDFLDEDSRRHHAEVRELLAAAGIPFRDAPELVRGLDYYTRTVFEVVSEGLGAQDALLGGGRYDNLVESLGGPPLPAIGFAIGEDRLLSVAPFRPEPRGLVLVLPGSPADVGEALRLSEEIREGFSGTVELDLSARGFRKGLSRANNLLEEAASRGLDRERLFAVLLGDRERAEETVTIKALASGAQETVPRRELRDRLSPGGPR